MLAISLTRSWKYGERVIHKFTKTLCVWCFRCVSIKPTVSNNCVRNSQPDSVLKLCFYRGSNFLLAGETTQTPTPTPPHTTALPDPPPTPKQYFINFSTLILSDKSHGFFTTSNTQYKIFLHGIYLKPVNLNTASKRHEP